MPSLRLRLRTNWNLRNNIDTNWKRNLRTKVLRSVSLKKSLMQRKRRKKQSRCESWLRSMISKRWSLSSRLRNKRWSNNSMRRSIKLRSSSRMRKLNSKKPTRSSKRRRKLDLKLSKIIRMSSKLKNQLSHNWAKRRKRNKRLRLPLSKRPKSTKSPSMLSRKSCQLTRKSKSN